MKRLHDPIDVETLRPPSGKRRFVPLKLLGESDVFVSFMLSSDNDSNLVVSMIRYSFAFLSVSLFLCDFVIFLFSACDSY